MPHLTPPWWAEALVLIAFILLGTWAYYADRHQLPLWELLEL